MLDIVTIPSPLFKQNLVLPLDEMIKFAKLKFMHCYANLKLPLSFHDLWPLNRDVNPERVLRNANNLRIPPHHFATIKRMPLFPSLNPGMKKKKRERIFHH